MAPLRKWIEDSINACTSLHVETILVFHYVALIDINGRLPHLQEVLYYLVAICNRDPMEQSSSNGSPDVTSRVIMDSINIPKLTCNWSISQVLGGNSSSPI